MKFARFLLILAMLPAVWPAFRASAADAPASRDELAKRLARAFKAKDQNAIMSLFDWQGVSQDTKTRQAAMISMMFEQDVKSVEPAPLPGGYPLEQTLGGVRYRANVKVVGLMKVTYADEDNPMEAGIAYGTKGNGFYLATLIEDKATPSLKSASGNPP